MRNRRYKSFKICAFLLILSLFAGCRRVPEPKTILLPEEETEQGVALGGEEGDRYAVRKMYNEDYETLWYGGYTAFLPGTKEHQVRLAENGTDGLRVRNLDYRYGFYDPGLFPVGEIMAATGVSTAWESGTADEQNMVTEFFSPDGKYLLYLRRDLSFVGGHLYLMDLESGEEELLLDGDGGDTDEEFPMDAFIILTAWSRDASLLCYGFYPRYSSVWDDYSGDKFVLYFRDMKTGEIVNRLNYYYAGTKGKPKNLEETRMYVDWDGQKIVTAIVSERQESEESNTAKSQQAFIDFFPQEIPKPGMETEGVVMPNVTVCPKDTKLYLDAEGGCLYFTSEGEGIISLALPDSSYINTMPIGPARGIRDFCVLDRGKAFVVAEYDRDHIGDMGPQDICLYTLSEEPSGDDGEEPAMTRRVLYQNAGYVIRLQYDPVYRRILAETGVPDMMTAEKNTQETKNYFSEPKVRWESGRRALVLEF